MGNPSLFVIPMIAASDQRDQLIPCPPFRIALINKKLGQNLPPGCPLTYGLERLYTIGAGGTTPLPPECWLCTTVVPRHCCLAAPRNSQVFLGAVRQQYRSSAVETGGHHRGDGGALRRTPQALIAEQLTDNQQLTKRLGAPVGIVLLPCTLFMPNAQPLVPQWVARNGCF